MRCDITAWAVLEISKFHSHSFHYTNTKLNMNIDRRGTMKARVSEREKGGEEQGKRKRRKQRRKIDAMSQNCVCDI